VCVCGLGQLLPKQYQHPLVSGCFGLKQPQAAEHEQDQNDDDDHNVTDGRSMDLFRIVSVARDPVSA